MARLRLIPAGREVWIAGPRHVGRGTLVVSASVTMKYFWLGRRPTILDVEKRIVPSGHAMVRAAFGAIGINLKLERTQVEFLTGRRVRVTASWAERTKAEVVAP